jgi:hypothetical protein
MEFLMHTPPPGAVLTPQTFATLRVCCAKLLDVTELTRIDYEDTFLVPCPLEVSATDVLLAFFSATPRIVECLLVLRNAAVSLLGLKSTARRRRLDPAMLRSGSRVGLFELGPIHAHSAVIGADDAHLNFRVLLSSEHTSLRCKTQVEFHNTLGRVYFFFVKPLHRFIVPLMLRSTARLLQRHVPAAVRPSAS